MRIKLAVLEECSRGRFSLNADALRSGGYTSEHDDVPSSVLEKRMVKPEKEDGIDEDVEAEIEEAAEAGMATGFATAVLEDLATDLDVAAKNSFQEEEEGGEKSGSEKSDKGVDDLSLSELEKSIAELDKELLDEDSKAAAEAARKAGSRWAWSVVQESGDRSLIGGAIFFRRIFRVCGGGVLDVVRCAFLDGESLVTSQTSTGGDTSPW